MGLPILEMALCETYIVVLSRSVDIYNIVGRLHCTRSTLSSMGGDWLSQCDKLINSLNPPNQCVTRFTSCLLCSVLLS